MVRLEQFDEKERDHLLNLPCPTYDTTPFTVGPELSGSRIAVVSTAGLHRRADLPFGIGDTSYRLIPAGIEPDDLVMSHISTNFDRTGFQMDMNMVLPLDRLKELEEEGFIGSIGDYHYSFMGATDPVAMEQQARDVAVLLKKDRVTGVLLVPV
jgi:D-proline reductase (dithiol) PrdB